MKIVIISRCIYPALAPRPHRATELAKYFASVGHDVYLYAVLGKYDYSGFERETGVHVRNIGKMRFATLDSDDHCRNNIFDRIGLRLLKKAFEYPDIELSWKVYRIIKTMPNVDLLITIAFPFPIHWGAAVAKFKYPDLFPSVWVSDCGDPYMGNSIEHHPGYFWSIENFWGKQTDYISIPIAEGRKAYSPQVQQKIRIIPQGFDFTNIKIDKDFKGNTTPRFAYTGVIYPGYRDPTKFLNHLSELHNLSFEFVIYTKQKDFFYPFKELLGEKLQLKDYVPREQLIYELSQMDFLINLQNKSNVQAPSKLIDYILSSRPILDITNDFSEMFIFNEFLKGDYKNQHKNEDISQYDIRNVGNQFLKIYNESISCR